jgi:hypothetical protein
MSTLEGGIEDPDGSDPPPPLDGEIGWDLDPLTRAGHQLKRRRGGQLEQTGARRGGQLDC